MKTFVVENGIQATEKINHLEVEGFVKDDIYLFAHDPSRSKHLTSGTDTESVGISEQGVFSSMKNVFRSRGDELRSKMVSLGLTENEAAHMEEELDKGKVVIVAHQ
ncbi:MULTISPECIES: general stress protein [Bacillaceae]|uniref:general stress protein n=1 Tax=Bacillaceae TaxID=186817 RepID=UPI000C78AFCC|nr:MULTISPECIES: general stress protein [Bacillaceae]PLR67793.1 general stress protein [Bacillus sp. UMB0893]QNG60068.1 general stress protein [Bacillus sp. PAMC26568]